MSSGEESWYIVQQDMGHCAICSSREIDDDMQAAAAEGNGENAPKVWGPFSSEGEAIARRVGLIRAGKCKPYLG